MPLPWYCFYGQQCKSPILDMRTPQGTPFLQNAMFVAGMTQEMRKNILEFLDPAQKMHEPLQMKTDVREQRFSKDIAEPKDAELMGSQKIRLKMKISWQKRSCLRHSFAGLSFARKELAIWERVTNCIVEFPCTKPLQIPFNRSTMHM